MKRLFMLSVFGVIMTTTACTMIDEPVVQEEQQQVELRENAMTLENLKEILLEKEQVLKSYSAEGKNVTKMIVEGQEVQFTMHMEVDTILSPLIIKEKISMNHQGEQKVVEIIVNEKGVITITPYQETSTQLSHTEESYQKYLKEFESLHPFKQLNMLETFEPLIELDVIENEIVVSFQSEGGDLHQLLMNISNGYLPSEFNYLVEQHLIELTSLDYKVVYDKQSYYPKTTQMKVILEIKNHDLSNKIHVDMTMNYSNYNSVEEISLLSK